MSPAKKRKKVVRVEPTESTSSGSSSSGSASSGSGAGPTWKPTPEANARATKLRIFAGILWLIAIGGEAYAIFGVLQQDPVKMWLLIVLIVVIGILSVGGSLLWKQANRLDPASKKDTVRFFVQNQLGAIIAIIAFLPLIILIFLNKDMEGKDKAIAGGIGIVVLLIAGFIGVSTDSPSVEQYSDETNKVVELTGQDLVYWTKSGKVFHLCEDASAVNLESKDNTIYSGTVADAHAAGKERLTLQVDQEVKQCGLTPAAGSDESGAAEESGATGSDAGVPESEAEQSPADEPVVSSAG